MNEPIKLVSQGGSTSIHIDMRIQDNGDLLFSGQDIGDAPSEIFGDLDWAHSQVIQPQSAHSTLGLTTQPCKASLPVRILMR